MKITVVKRSEDYMAHIEGEPSYWDCGKTPNEAIGGLIRTWREKFNIHIKEIFPKLFKSWCSKCQDDTEHEHDGDYAICNKCNRKQLF